MFFINTLDTFSKNFNYQYLNLDVSGIDNVDYNLLEEKLSKYSKDSIFLLPLEKISKEIKQNNWIKTVKLKTDYKDTLFIVIEEYKPIGIYKYNNKFFYFDRNGKIIEEILSNNFENDLMVFSGQSSNLQAYALIKIMKNLSFNKRFQINRIDFINKRRWDILLKNNIKLMLSEISPKNSLENFIKIEKNLSEIEMNDIKYFDLRDINKTIISYKE